MFNWQLPSFPAEIQMKTSQKSNCILCKSYTSAKDKKIDGFLHCVSKELLQNVDHTNKQHVRKVENTMGPKP